MSLMVEYQQWQSGQWADPHPKDCPCHGSGWAVSDLDTLHKCGYHYNGQPHPESDECWDSNDLPTDEIFTESEKEHLVYNDDDIPF